jgi:hypothetical protein
MAASADISGQVAQGRDLVEPGSGKMNVSLNCSCHGSWPAVGRIAVVGVHPELNRLFAQPERLTKTAADGHRPFVPAV